MAKDLDQDITQAGSFRQHYEEWLGRKWRNNTFKKVWNASFFAIAWSLWLMRNEVIFQKKTVDLEDICSLIRWRVTFWAKAWKEKLPLNENEADRYFAEVLVFFLK